MAQVLLMAARPNVGYNLRASGRGQLMLVGRRYLISGRVKGVGFRFFTCEAASREGIAGFVRNLPDRRVEVVAEGEADAMSRFEAVIRQGPIGARVDDVETDVVPAAGRYDGFSVTGWAAD
jgi:acylphosphatase